MSCLVYPIADLRKMIIGASTGDGSFFRFMQRLIDELRQVGKFGNARVYRHSLKAWKNYRNNKDIEFQQIDYRVLKEFENYFLARKTKPKTGKASLPLQFKSSVHTIGKKL